MYDRAPIPQRSPKLTQRPLRALRAACHRCSARSNSRVEGRLVLSQAIAVTLQITQGQEPLRVYEAPLVQHLEMQMRTSGSARRTHCTDTLCRRDDLTLANIQSRQVGIARDQAIALVDLHQFAVGTSR